MTAAALKAMLIGSIVVAAFWLALAAAELAPGLGGLMAHMRAVLS